MARDGGAVLTVIIPTLGLRPGMLEDAVRSALAVLPGAGIEVIVVCNGGARDACTLVHERVRFINVAERNGNVARNVGLRHARGEFVRFLDDDDLLDPSGVREQLEHMRALGADISTGAVRHVDARLQEFGRYEPASDDFVVELFEQRGSTMCVAQMFRKGAIAGLQWDPARGYLQDVDWMHSFIRRGEAHWTPFTGVVGSWRHHPGWRVSRVGGQSRADMPARDAVAIIAASISALEAQNRLTPARRQAAAKALWDYAHAGFRHAPTYWEKVGERALDLDPSSRPEAALLRAWPFSRMAPITAEKVLFPLRAVVNGLLEAMPWRIPRP